MTTTPSTLQERREAAAKLKARVDASRPQIARTSYTVDEIAAMEGVNRNSIYAAIRSGDLGHFKIGRLIRVTPEHLDAFRAGAAGTA